MLPWFSFKNEKSADFDLIVKAGRTIGSPERDIDHIEVPGRMGDLLSDNKRFKNYDDEYECGFWTTDNLERKAHAVRSWLQGSAAYGRLLDWRDPDYYRMAVCTTALNLEKQLATVGTVKVVFNCKPQFFRVDGDTIKSFAAEGTLVNPEPWESAPYIKIMATGDVTLHINDQEIVITGISDYIEVDSELRACYRGGDLQNTKYRSDDWPVLVPGNNTISWDGSVSKVEIKPRWWTL